MKTDWQVVAFQEDGMWVAQCLTHDIAAQANTFEGAIDSLKAIATRYAELAIAAGKVPFEDFEEAPAGFRKMYDDHPRFRVQTTFDLPGGLLPSRLAPAQIAIAA